MFNRDSKELFRNMTSFPKKDSTEYEAFVLEEYKKCDEGVTINGIFLPPSFYYDINYHHIEKDTLTGTVIGLADARDNGWIIHNDYYQAQKNKVHYVVGGSRQIGKALLNSSKLYQEDKEITIGEAKIGDKIFGDDGELTTITGVYPQGIRPVYKITLQDGRELYCDENHKWKVSSGEVLSTLDLLKDNYSIPNCQPINDDVRHYCEVLLYTNFIKSENNDYYLNLSECWVQVFRSAGFSCYFKDDYLVVSTEPSKIISIEYVFDDYTTCITVDNESHCFLTDDYTVTHNSDIMTSLAMRELMLYERALVLFVCNSDYDHQTFSGKLKTALTHQVDFFKVPNIDKDLTKKYIRFGFKETDNEDELHSRLYVVNTDDGKNTQNSAGKTPTLVLYDEIAKSPMAKTWNTIKPAYEGKYGFRNSAFFAFTGGEVEKSVQAEKFYKNPKASKILSFNQDGYDCGRFLGGWYKSSLKKDGIFGEYLKEVEGKELDKNSELYTLPMSYCIKEEADKILIEEEQNYLQAKDIQSYNDHKIFYPRKVDDMFLKLKSNPFEHLLNEFESLLVHLETQNLQSKAIELFGDEKSEIVFRFSEKQPILSYPIDPKLDYLKESSLVMVDAPRLQYGTKLYVSGADPFNVDKTEESPSLGSFYIMRKQTSDYTDVYNGRIVAWYNGRKNISHFRKLLLQSLLFYGGKQGNITLLHESVDDTLTQWFTEKNLGYILEDTYTLNKEISPNAKSTKSKGVPASKKYQDYYLSKMLDYCEEVLPDGRLGLWRIPDPYLIKQIMSFDGNLSDKDAMVAFGHCLMHYYKEARYVPQIYKEDKEDFKKLEKQHSFFGTSTTNFKRNII